MYMFTKNQHVYKFEVSGGDTFTDHVAAVAEDHGKASPQVLVKNDSVSEGWVSVRFNDSETYFTLYKGEAYDASGLLVEKVEIDASHSGAVAQSVEVIVNV